jgi:hypothetical protein
MPLLRGSVRATHILDDNKLASDATGLSDERGASVRRQVVEEMAGEDPVELAVVERQRCNISLEHTRVRHPGRRNPDHPGALVERHHLAAQMLGEEARAACDIEHPRRGQGSHDADQLLDLRSPAGSLAFRERSRAEPPAVVFSRTLVEMRAHLIVRLALGHLGDSRRVDVQPGVPRFASGTVSRQVRRHLDNGEPRGMPIASTYARLTQRMVRGWPDAPDPSKQAAAMIKRHQEANALREKHEIADAYGAWRPRLRLWPRRPRP